MIERLPASVGGLRQLLQGLFLLALVAWVLDLPGRLGLAIYTEQ